MRRSAVIGCALALASATPAAARPGELDPGFGTHGLAFADVYGREDAAYGAVVQTDGRLVLAGDSAPTGSSSGQFALARFNRNGRLDPGFGGLGTAVSPIGSASQARAVVERPDERLLAGGWAHVGANDVFALARYRTAGGLDDTGFGAGTGVVTTPVGSGAARADALKLAPDESIVLAGQARFGGHQVFGLARYHPDGSLDSGFGGPGSAAGTVLTSVGGGDAAAHALAGQSNGMLVAAGEAVGRFALARYTSQGALDPGFGGTGTVVTPVGDDGSAHATGLALQTDGRLVAAGDATSGGAPRLALARYLADGTLDPQFGQGGIVLADVGGVAVHVAGVAVQRDGLIVVGGWIDDGGGATRLLLARYRRDGSLDPSFGTQGISVVGAGAGAQANALALMDSGKAILTGSGPSPNGANRDMLAARFTTDVADLRLSGSAPARVPTGARIAIRLTVTNRGPDPSAGTSLFATLPRALTLASASGRHVRCHGRRSVTCRLGTLTAHQRVTVTIRARAVRAGRVRAYPGVAGTTFDPRAVDNQRRVSVTVIR